MSRGSHVGGLIALGLVAFALGLVAFGFATTARADNLLRAHGAIKNKNKDTVNKILSPTSNHIEQNKLAQLSIVIWQRLITRLRVEAPPPISDELAAKVFQLSAQITVPGFPLPKLGAVALPSFETLPVAKAILTSNFGYRRDPINGRGKRHAGIDFSAPSGTTVRAAGSGVVVKAETTGGYGRLIVIDHGRGFVSRYAHLSSMKVRVGERILAGERIGAVGSSGRVTGPHLHFEIRVLGTAIDPAPFLHIGPPSFGRRLQNLLTLLIRHHQQAPQLSKRDRHLNRG